jgi:hypothetical protein
VASVVMDEPPKATKASAKRLCKIGEGGLDHPIGDFFDTDFEQEVRH